MKIVLIVAGVLVGLVILAAVIGAFLPKTHVARCQAAFRKKPEELWAKLSDFAAWPSWNTWVLRNERQPDRDGKAVWLSVGKRWKMPMVVEVFEPPRRLHTVIPEDAGIGFSGSWTYEIEATADGCTLRLTERGSVSNPLFRFLSGVLMDQHATMRAFLRDLGRGLGEQVEPRELKDG